MAEAGNDVDSESCSATGGSESPELDPCGGLSEAELDLMNFKLMQFKYSLEDANTVPPELPLDPFHVNKLCMVSKDAFCKEPSLLRPEIPDDSSVVIVGSLNGDLCSLINIFDRLGYPPHQRYLFLGNFIGEKRQSLATFCLLLILKLKHPQCIFLLRGQNESGSMIRTGIAFRSECCRVYNQSVVQAFRMVFYSLPFAAVISDKVFCVSGGLSPELNAITQIDDIQRPTDCPRHGLRCDLMWARHDSKTAGWAEISKSKMPACPVRSYYFGGEIVSRFLIKNNFDIMCTAAGFGEHIPTGYTFSAWKQLVTLSSAPLQTANKISNGAVLVINDTLGCSFSEFRVPHEPVT